MSSAPRSSTTAQASGAGPRPTHHFTPPTGWMNDPNGLIDWNGLHHLYFQYNPDDTRQGRIRWGHASTADFIHWTAHPDALLPGEPDTHYDADGCYSGCAVVDGDVVRLLYTGVHGDLQLPCLATATSPDLDTFVKYAGNPVIGELPMADVVAFRDHAVFRDGKAWCHAVGGGTRSLGGAVFEYRGTTLDEWRFQDVVLDSRHSVIPGDIWECPDLFLTGDAAVLIVSVIDESTNFPVDRPRVWYATGAFEGSRLTPRHEELLDYGDRFYAPQSYWTGDGRRIMFGWVRTDQDPAAARLDFRGAMTLPRELLLRNGVLYQRPAREVFAALGSGPVIRPEPGQLRMEVTLDHPLRAAEVEIAGGSPDVDSIELFSADGTGLRVDVTAIPSDPNAPGGPSTTCFFDAGIVETFRDGRVHTCTDLRLDNLARVVIHRSQECTAQSVSVRPLLE